MNCRPVVLGPIVRCLVARRLALAISILLPLIVAGPIRIAAAQPSPLDSGLWSFPSSAAAPASARSASLGLADRWLGTEPFDNPAARLGAGASLSGLLEHVSRQDLHADNRNFEEETAFIDLGGAWLSIPVAGVGLAAYVYQPVLRLESNAFTRGEPGALVIPAAVSSSGTSRELRTGVAASHAWGELRFGVAGEWTHRDDVYELVEQSGSPDQGTRHVDFSGDAYGGQAGITWGEDRPDRPVQLGVAFRLVPALSVDGIQQFTLLSGDSLGQVSAERGSSYEAGASVSVRTAATFRVIGGAGTRSERTWDGFAVKSGDAWQWALGGEFHDSRDPWTLRFGGGQEQEQSVSEPRSGLFGLGLQWDFQHSSFEVGLLHRSIFRSGEPLSSDDRVLATLTAWF